MKSYFILNRLSADMVLNQTQIDLDVVAALVNSQISGAVQIGKGKNSVVTRINTQDNNHYVAKTYRDRTMEGRNRLETEFSSVSFLWNNGVCCVPEPVAVDTNTNIAVYRFVAGEEIDSKSLCTRDINQFIDFLSTLKDLSKNADAQALAPASEACFSLIDIENNIDYRLAKLQVNACESPLENLLQKRFKPLYQQSLKQAEKALKQIKGSTTKPLPVSDRTLSQSDFGTHNSLRQADGKIIFVDFEYFGWDDPVKVISDFLLHPAMTLPENQKQDFTKRSFDLFGGASDLRTRLYAMFPLYALKWVLILLNEFIPGYLERIGLSSDKETQADLVRQQQFEKAEDMLVKTQSSLQKFEYTV